MKRTLFLAATALFVLPAVLLAHGTEWTIDPAHSNASFAVKHLGVATVRGNIPAVSGTLTYDDHDVTQSKLDVTIDASAISTGVEKRDEHLKSVDFLDTANHPKITFQSTKVKQAGAGKLEVTGNLTIRGVTKPVTLTVEGPTAPIDDPWGNQAMGASATTMILRKDFGVSWGAVTEAGGLVAANEVNILLDVELKRPKAKEETMPAKAKEKEKSKGGW